MSVLDEDLAPPSLSPRLARDYADIETYARETGLIASLKRLLRQREARRVIAFLIAGGVSAIVTMATTASLTHFAGFSFLLASVVGIELGILVNFSFNDRLAFRDLSGHRRVLPVRLGRFHVTCALGQSLILLSSLLLHDALHWPGTFAQALPIALVTCVNFLMHRFWTYRGARAHVSR
ncbi:MAG TPA: GtrA family protein [Ktedonobacterales bacterium]|nr:GtrA family protein [Ktedonobacterales bacterium]